jgi:secreted trypsin-like serine protease
MPRAVRAVLLALAGVLALPAAAPAIVGGETTGRAWPHMAGMERRDPADGGWRFRCGASLVRPDVVLTAAHCVDADDGGTLPAGELRFLLGTNVRSAGGERIAAEAIVEHPAYDASDGRTSDVALVRLAAPSALGRPIRIAGPGDASRWEPGDPAVILGWGTEHAGASSIPDALKEAEVPIVSDGACRVSYALTLGFDPATNVCAGNLVGGEDSCQGDSGGPLQVLDAGGAWVQVGVVSYGLGCAFPTQYGVYAEAGGDALRGWIGRTADALAAAPAPPAGPAAAAGQAAPPAASAPSGRLAAPLRTRLIAPRRVRIGRRIRVVLRTGTRLRQITVSLRRGRRLPASGRRATLRAGRGRVVLTARRRRIAPGRATLRVRARDASGRRVALTRSVRLTRR